MFRNNAHQQLAIRNQELALKGTKLLSTFYFLFPVIYQREIA